MKKIIFILLLIIPCFCWGQTHKVTDRIEVTDDMKKLSLEKGLGLKLINGEPFVDDRTHFLSENLAGCICDPIIISPKEEYEVIVFDAGFSSFLATQKSPAFYSESTLKAKNALMVNEWNSRHRQPSLYDSSIYEVNIDYNQNIDYGLGVEYQLYMFFRYMEKENNMSLIGDYYAAR